MTDDNKQDRDETGELDSDTVRRAKLSLGDSEFSDVNERPTLQMEVITEQSAPTESIQVSDDLLLAAMDSDWVFEEEQTATHHATLDRPPRFDEFGSPDPTELVPFRNAEAFETTIGASGQIRLPADIADRRSLKPGSRVKVWIEPID